MTIDKERLLRFHQGPTKMKEEIVAIAGHLDIPPALFVAWQSGRHFGGSITDRVAHALSEGITTLDVVILDSLAVLMAKVDPDDVLRSVTFAAENYFVYEGDTRPAGRLADDFENNPNTVVKEAVTTYFFELDDEGLPHCSVVHSPYTYGDESVDWGEPQFFGLPDTKPLQEDEIISTIFSALFVMGGAR